MTLKRQFSLTRTRHTNPLKPGIDIDCLLAQVRAEQAGGVR